MTSIVLYEDDDVAAGTKKAMTDTSKIKIENNIVKVFTGNAFASKVVYVAGNTDSN